MNTPLLQTKWYISPPPPGLLPRPRLYQQLNSAVTVAHGATLISTPAGYGKTTLLSAWIRTQATPPVAWLSLEDDDNDPARFLAYLTAAIATIHPVAAERAKVLLQTFHSQPSIQTVLAAIINALAKDDAPLVIALDDYHAIEHPAIHQGVEFLLNHLPPQLHLIIASRVDPPWPLARLRAQRRLTELRINDLCFTFDEITEFFNRINNLDLPADALEALQNRTEGWVASLQLAALSLLRLSHDERNTFIAAFTSSHHYIFDYLAEELFSKQGATDQHFLLQTSILNHLTAPLCAAVTGQADSQSRLEQLHHLNLLMAQDDNRQWYRYHPLFAEFLRQNLSQSSAEADVTGLYLRASHWCEANHDLDEAIHYALVARAWESALRLLKSLAAPMQFMQYAQKWQRWLAALPAESWQSDIELTVGHAWALMSTGQWAIARQLLQQAAAACRAENNTAQLGQVHTAASYLKRMLGDVPGAIEQASQALECLSPEDAAYRMSATRLLGIHYLRLGKARASAEILTQAMTDIYRYGDEAAALLGLVWLGQAQFAGGQLRQVSHTRSEVLRLAQAQQRTPPLIFYVWATWLYYEWNELDKAAEFWELALERQALLRNRAFPEYFTGLARLQWAQGESGPAYATLHRALNFAQQVHNDIARAHLTAQYIQFKLAEDDLESCFTWLEAHPASPDDKFVYLRQDEYLTRVRVLLRRRSPAALAEARWWLDQLLAYATTDGRQSDQVKILLLKAIFDAQTNNLEPAMQSLTQALALAEPENYIRTFLDEGPPLLELLQYAVRQNIAPAYATRLLQAAGHAVAPPAAGPASPPHSLSEREVEVLTLLSKYYSPQEISDSLIISIHTTRTHIKQIYRKLDVRSRKQAISTARKLNLV